MARRSNSHPTKCFNAKCNQTWPYMIVHLQRRHRQKMTQQQQNQPKAQKSFCIYQSCVLAQTNKSKYVETLQTSPKNNKNKSAPAGGWYFLVFY
jgi:hypothetical protein